MPGVGWRPWRSPIFSPHVLVVKSPAEGPELQSVGNLPMLAASAALPGLLASSAERTADAALPPDSAALAEAESGKLNNRRLIRIYGVDMESA